MTVAETRSARIEVRTTPNVQALLQRASSSSRKNVTEFLLDAGIDATEDTLAGKNILEGRRRVVEGIGIVADRNGGGKGASGFAPIGAVGRSRQANGPIGSVPARPD